MSDWVFYPGLEREIVVWNPYTGKPVISLEGHQAGIMRLEVNADFEQASSSAMRAHVAHELTMCM